ncbi:phenylalanine--tRNA ligase subunit alpha [Candidatus Woesearchaeota archaeon]|nr:phenylalanine--tRNA ligase subunit alpha [Candidatus Woesearchaeota archaeon]
MDDNNLIKKLHLFERKTLPNITDNITISKLAEKASLKEIEATRAIQWLSNKNLVNIAEEIKDIITLDENGLKYVKDGLPERRFLKAINGKTKVSELKNKGKLEDDEINICIGSLKKKAAINIDKDKEIIISLTDHGKKLMKKEFLEETFLKKDFPLELKYLSPEEKFSFDNLIKRKRILKKETKKIKKITLTAEGKKLSKKVDSKANYAERLTPGMLKDGSWKKKTFREYDVNINVPKINRGKRHFVSQAIEYAKDIWLELGFKEMTGPMLQTSFWNFDALFTAQDHPVRDMQDTYFAKNPGTGKLPNKELVSRVKKTHEDGWTTNSKGWKYDWKEEDAKKNVLRTHTTVLSAQTLAKLTKEGIPAKFFSVGKCFRNETIDWSHLFEFNQTDGIVVDENANFRHLLGYLKAFFKKMGYEKARFRPAYFPYTEFSVEIDVLHPVHNEWFELGGAGIFRPEVVKPLLGIDIPVLAWGPGFDRIILEFFKINDIRDLYKNDLKQLREIKDWMR